MQELEFSQDLAPTLVASTQPVLITRDGEVLGTYFPKHRWTAEEEARFREAAAQVDDALRAAGISEDEIYADIDRVAAMRHR